MQGREGHGTLIDNADKALYKAKVSGKTGLLYGQNHLASPEDNPASDRLFSSPMFSSSS